LLVFDEVRRRHPHVRRPRYRRRPGAWLPIRRSRATSRNCSACTRGSFVYGLTATPGTALLRGAGRSARGARAQVERQRPSVQP
jgi:hypothetical protein